MHVEHEMFEKFGGGETNRQGQAVEIILCQANIDTNSSIDFEKLH